MLEGGGEGCSTEGSTSIFTCMCQRVLCVFVRVCARACVCVCGGLVARGRGFVAPKVKGWSTFMGARVIECWALCCGPGKMMFNSCSGAAELLFLVSCGGEACRVWKGVRQSKWAVTHVASCSCFLDNSASMFGDFESVGHRNTTHEHSLRQQVTSSLDMAQVATEVTILSMVMATMGTTGERKEPRCAADFFR